ncbi:hypothetical protein IF2G_06730 [Cordyceps javanica]|nr:hypothetical protein IF2G_06730 [Cordyceps javanica]
MPPGQECRALGSDLKPPVAHETNLLQLSSTALISLVTDPEIEGIQLLKREGRESGTTHNLCDCRAGSGRSHDYMS